MRLHVKTFALTGGIMWSLSVLTVGTLNLLWPNYGRLFLELVASIYPGYHVGTDIGSVIIGTLYALFDGIIGGALFAWIYNMLLKTSESKH